MFSYSSVVRSVVFLTRENNELREQNELLRQMLAAEMPTESTSAIDRFQAENAALKLALYESVQNLAKQKTIGGLPIGAQGLPVSSGGMPTSSAMAAAMAAVSSAPSTFAPGGAPGANQALLQGLAQSNHPAGLSLLANQGLMQLVGGANVAPAGANPLLASQLAAAGAAGLKPAGIPGAPIPGGASAAVLLARQQAAGGVIAAVAGDEVAKPAAEPVV